MNVDIRQLRYFVRIVETGSFSKASVDLGIAQSALSYQVREMEAALHAQLLVRHRQGVSLTEAGRAVLERASVIISEINALRSEVSASSRFPSGTVTFAAPPTPAKLVVPQVVERFRQQFPNVRLVVREGPSGAVRDWLASGTIDVGLLYDFAIGEKTNAVVLLTEEMHFVGAAGASRPPEGASIEEILALPLVLTERSYEWRLTVERALADRQIRLNVSAEVNSLATIRELVRRNFAYSILPQSVLYPELASGEVWAMALAGLRIPVTLNLVRAANRPVSVASRELQRIISEEVAKLEMESLRNN
ncbi:LysR family transcriptional regulator [Arvimicrobium flavum]|uniref:LysR family transcriptional regulator n=1 Tax=Arvimicrobium flavum TaxID=3393320 RepID=UPI00237B3FE0|nr:LysR family transcriptional regulator [Mesorhizobium shangrilense]